MKNKIKYILSLSAKFTYFETARILYKRNQLAKIICGYPWFKLRNEKIPKKLVSSNAFKQAVDAQEKNRNTELEIINPSGTENAPQGMSIDDVRKLLGN